MSDLSVLIRRHRLRVGMTQQELAQRGEVSVRTVRDLELGKVHSPRGRTLAAISAALRLSPEDRTELIAATQTLGGLRVGVLGPLTVQRNGSPVAVGPPLHRTLLGLLALHRGDFVGRDEAIDVLWGEHPPRTCVERLHSLVAGVRAFLGERDARTLLQSTRGGYVLSLDPDAVDAARFEKLVAQASNGRQACGGALGLLAEALGAWRGPVLADATERLRHHPVSLALARRRVAVVLAYAEATEAAGTAGLAVDPLESVASDEPFDEAVHARLLGALAQTGRRADALARYTLIRRRLVDELGVEPGPELRRIHLALLREQAGPPNPDADAVSAAPVPAQLPLDIRGFTGRADTIAEMDAVLDAGQPQSVTVIAVTGTAGIGKSAVALHWAHRVAGRFPDGLLYADLRGFDPSAKPVPAFQVLRRFLTALRVAPELVPDTCEAQTDLYRSVLATRRILVVLDNARDAAQVRPLLPGSPSCMALVTSRDQLIDLVAREGARPVVLEALSREDATALMAQRLGEARVAAEPDAADAIAEATGRLPLALAIIASRAACTPTISLRALADQLSDGTPSRRLDALAAEGPMTDLRLIFSSSYRALDNESSRLFRLLGLFPGPDFAAPAAASLAGVSAAAAATSLARLSRASLLTEHGTGRYKCHDLVRAYATELAGRLDPADEQRAAVRRTLDHYLHTARVADRHLDPHRVAIHFSTAGVRPEELSDSESALDWFDREYSTLVALIDAAAARRFDAHVWRLAWNLASYFERRGNWPDWISTHQVALAATERLGDTAATAFLRYSLGKAYCHSAATDDAERQYCLAIELFRQHGNELGEAHTHINLCWVLDRQGRHVESLNHAQQALDLLRDTGDDTGKARALNATGWFLCQLGRHEEALAPCREALDLFVSLGNRRGEAGTLDSLGCIHLELGEHDRAMDCHRRALSLRQADNDHYFTAESLHHIGDTYQAAGDVAAARVAWESALVLLDELNHPDADLLRRKRNRSMCQCDSPPQSTRGNAMALQWPCNGDCDSLTYEPPFWLQPAPATARIRLGVSGAASCGDPSGERGRK